ncbi:hypothetical protein B7463_g11392, partial [Scytalidium lignicola]
MDAAEEEQDVKLQRASADLIADFQNSLQPFLWKTTADGKLHIRRRVRSRETDRLVALLEPFQELPQLLDPHLNAFLPVLSDALLAFLRAKPNPRTLPQQGEKEHTHQQLLMPLSKAICRLIYTFCKIRGEKVIVRFLSTETRHLELLLSAIEAWRGDVSTGEDHAQVHTGGAGAWGWEERYVVLLWLSHLLLAPFDLTSISSSDDVEKAAIAGLTWPENLPGVTVRVISLAVAYLSSSGKERDAAKVLLVRVAMRRDMQKLGVLNALVKWAISCLRPSSEVAPSTYHYIGVLSFLAGILVSSINTSDMDPYLLNIFYVMQGISNEDNEVYNAIRSSAVARKTLIKVYRSISVLVLRKPEAMTSEIVESTIGRMLEFLADQATPVRLATSKALSVITLKLPEDMAAQVVDAVLESLNQNVLWVDHPNVERRRNLSSVNPLEWHGLILTLSHLLYRRSPPPQSLAEIIPALLLGLSFEQRSTAGSSLGTNVRDAACFGIWALARRYTTVELQAISTREMSQKIRDKNRSVLQVLASELVVCACLDPAGNIRRGASAALQELIGRHPDTIAEGIKVVQVVDYHAVALRSRAVQDVALEAAQLSPFYMNGLVDGLFGWRGVGDADASSRRSSATSLGNLVRISRIGHLGFPWDVYSDIISRIEGQINDLTSREVDIRHGLILCLASVIDTLKLLFTASILASELQKPTGMKAVVSNILRVSIVMLEDATTSTYRRPELLAEAISRFIITLYPVLAAEIVFSGFPVSKYITGVFEPSISSIRVVDEAYEIGFLPNIKVLDLVKGLLANWLHRNEKEVIEAASAASIGLFILSNAVKRRELIRDWAVVVSENLSSRSGQDKGYLFALWSIVPFSGPLEKDICDAIYHRWTTSQDIETHATILACIISGVPEAQLGSISDMIIAGLDDYTTDSRGDVGSIVRIEAVKAAAQIWQPVNEMDAAKKAFFDKIFGKVLRLATEKLDKVRAEAQKAVASACRQTPESSTFASVSTSSYTYFRFILDMETHDWLQTGPYNLEWRAEMVEGYVTSADTGSEDLVRVSRAALADFCNREGNIDLVCETLFEVLKKNLNNDRVLVPTLEVVGFLFDVGIMRRSSLNWRSLSLNVQKAHYKTGNVRKLEACIKVYSGLVEVYPEEALKRLTALLLHPFPRVRNQVVDTLFAVRGVGKGVNWGKGNRDDVKRLKEVLGVVKSISTKAGNYDLIIERIDDLITLANERFYAYPYKDVPLCWRELYIDASLLKFSTVAFRNGWANSRTAATNPNDIPLLSSDDIAEMVKIIDMALILAGVPASFSSDETQALNTATELLRALHAEIAKLRRYYLDTQASVFPQHSVFVPPVFNGVPRVSSLSFEEFERYMWNPPSIDVGPEPLIIKEALKSWPARAERPWGNPAYLMEQTIGGNRLVPIETGRTYVDEGWGQKIVPFKEFMEDYVLVDPSSPKATMGYLAQHNLFTQLPVLRNDICIPDYCWADAPPPHYSSPLAEHHAKLPKLEEPLLNAWFGPGGTISPLHTDPYHNILAQVVGRKYVRLYPPAASNNVYPRGIEEGGINMQNTSEVDVGVLEGWDSSETEQSAAHERFPLFSEAKFIDCILEEGECLYIPLGWWHYVRSLSVSFSNSKRKSPDSAKYLSLTWGAGAFSDTPLRTLTGEMFNSDGCAAQPLVFYNGVEDSKIASIADWIVKQTNSPDEATLMLRNTTEHVTERRRRAANAQELNGAVIHKAKSKRPSNKNSEPRVTHDASASQSKPTIENSSSATNLEIQLRRSFYDMYLPNPYLLAPNLEQRSKDFFIANYVLQGPGLSTEFYHADSLDKLLSRADEDEHLLYSIKAVGLAMFANSAQAPHLLQEARRDYIRALQLTNKALESPSSAKTDSTLFAVLILSIFETLAGSSQDSLNAWTKHIEGAAILIGLRGPSQFATAAGRRLFFHTISNLFISYIQRGLSFPAHIIELRKESSKNVNTFNMGWETSSLVIDFANFRAAVKNKEITEVRTIYRIAMELEQRFIDLFSDLPEHWNFTTHYTNADPTSIWDGYYHTYHDVWISQVWNSTRTCRLMLHEIIQAALRSGWEGNPPLFSQEQFLTQMSESWRITIKLRDDLLASIPQQINSNFNQNPQSPTSPADKGRPTPQLRGMTGYYVVWQLFVAGSLEQTNAKLRAWIGKRIRFVGDALGVKQAIVIADILENYKPITAWDDDFVAKFDGITLSTPDNTTISR